MSTPKFSRDWLLIDRDALDEAIIEYPILFHNTAQAVTDAQSVRDEAKEHLEWIKAELDAKIRKQLKDAGERDTNDKVQAAILRDDDYIAATEKLADAQKAYSQANVDKEAMHQKSYMLRTMADLYAANYFSTSVGNGNGTRVITDDKAQRNKAAIADAARNSKRRRKRATLDEDD